MSARRWGSLAAVLAVGVVAGCGGGGHPIAGNCGTSGPGLTNATVRNLAHQACQEGRLVINYFASQTDAELGPWMSGFRAYYGFPSSFSISNYGNPDEVTTTEELISQVQAGHAPQFDVDMVSSNFVAQMEHAGVLDRGVFNGLPNLAGYTEDGGTAQAFYSALGGITYNTSKVPSSQLRSWVDVLTLPSSVEVVATPYATFNAGLLPSAWGQRDAVIYNVLLSRRPHFTTINCGSEESLVSSPAAVMASDCGNSAADALAAQHQPIAQLLPADGAMLSEQYLAIPRDDPDSAAAALWVNYLLTAPAQQVLWTDEHVDYWRLPGSHILAVLRSYLAKGWQLLEYTPSGPTPSWPSGVTPVMLPSSGLGQQGSRRDFFEDANMAEEAAEYAHSWQSLTPCIVEILNGSANSAACDPFRSYVNAAAGTPPSALP